MVNSVRRLTGVRTTEGFFSFGNNSTNGSTCKCRPALALLPSFEERGLDLPTARQYGILLDMTAREGQVFWLLFVAGGLAILWQLYRAFWQGRSRGRQRCFRCDYDMTGAPSHTCPECGHTARSVDEFTRNRRQYKPLVWAVLIAGLMYYTLEVRRRMEVSYEPLKRAVVPTTALILKGNFEATSCTGYYGESIRLFSIGNGSLQATSWQVWLQTQVAYREVMRQSKSQSLGQPFDGRYPLQALVEMLPHSDAAIGRLADVIRSAPHRQTRLDAIRQLGGSEAVTESMLSRIRPAVWEAYESRNLFVEDLHSTLSLWGPNTLTALSDERLTYEFRELAGYLRPDDRDDVMELYLKEVGRRRLPDGDRLIQRVAVGKSFYRPIAKTAALDLWHRRAPSLDVSLTPVERSPDYFQVTLTNRGFEPIKVRDAVPLDPNDPASMSRRSV